MKEIYVSTETAQGYNMSRGCSYGVISEGCVGYWGCGRTADGAIRNAKRELGHSDMGYGFELHIVNDRLCKSDKFSPDYAIID